jgi:drug/metabolite transporter (DMT)-like permease
MIELIVCILACASLVIAFKIFDKWKISSLPAIVVNYLVAGIIGLIYEPNSGTLLERKNDPWFINACILGLVFILNLFILGKSAQKMGASVTSVASKMSLVVTVIFCSIYFKESAGALKIIGIALALISIFFIVQINTKEIHPKFIFLPLILFIGGGFIDSFIYLNQKKYIHEGEDGLFATVTFSAAFVGGLCMLGYQLIKKRDTLNIKSIIGGVVLGLVNWLSIFTLLLTLKNGLWDSSTTYTIINIGILLIVVGCGVLIFREKLNKMQWMGVILAVSAIIIISLT